MSWTMNWANVGDRVKVQEKNPAAMYGKVGTVVGYDPMSMVARVVFETLTGFTVGPVPLRSLRWVGKSKELREDVLAVARTKANNFGYNLEAERDPKSGIIIGWKIMFEGEEVDRISQAEVAESVNPSATMMSWLKKIIRREERGPNVGDRRRPKNDEDRF